MKTANQTGNRKLMWGMACLLLVITLGAQSAAAATTRLVVRDKLGLTGITNTCLLLGCSVQRSLGDPQGQLFLVTSSSLLSPLNIIFQLLSSPGVVDVELDQLVNTQGAYAGTTPAYLTDSTPVSYYGTTVWHGYVA